MAIKTRFGTPVEIIAKCSDFETGDGQWVHVQDLEVPDRQLVVQTIDLRGTEDWLEVSEACRRAPFNNCDHER